MAFRFPGGVKVPHEKGLTAKKPLLRMPLPKILVVPLTQHIGAPLKLEVKKGDLVKKGQLLASPGGFVSSAIHAPTSGTVTAIEKRLHPGFGRGEAVVIEADGLDEWLPGLPLDRQPETMSVEEIRNAIRDGGVVGLGGAAFPTQVKLSPPADKKIDFLLVNGAECEPYLTSDHLAMRERGGDLLMGLRAAARAVGAQKAFIGIEENKPDVIASLSKLAQAEKRLPISVVSLPARYPQGAERSLIHAITGRKLAAGKLPMEVGVVVVNVCTLIAVADAVVRGLPVVDKIITVTGRAVKNPCNVQAPIGASFAEVLAVCDGFKEEPAKIIMGGPMMGIAQYTVDVPVIKATSGILCLTKDEAKQSAIGACIRCGRCVDACPMGLLPQELGLLADKGAFDKAEAEHVLDCVECGSCTFICPAHRPLVQWIRNAKTVIRANARKRKAS